MRDRIVLLIVLLLTTLLAGCTAWDVSRPVSGTYYESLALNSPKNATETFLDAFERQDYWTVYLVFAPQTQFLIQQNVNLLRYNTLVRVEGQDDLMAMLAGQSIGERFTSWEHMDVGSYFHELMVAATQHDQLLVDLSGAYTITEMAETTDEDGTKMVDVTVVVDGIEDPVVFRLTQSFSGRWRVRWVILAGGEPVDSASPWVLPEPVDTNE